MIKLNRQQRRQKKERLFSNKKGLQLIVTRLRINNIFYKYKKQLQRMNNKTIVHYVEA